MPSADPGTRSPTSSPRIRILCVDDHRIVREGIGLLVGREPDMEVVAVASNGAQAVASFRRFRPDITLMDLQLPVLSGLEAIRVIRAETPAARIIVLTMHQGEEDIYHALKAGAATYLSKDALSDDLINAVRVVHSGGHPIPPQIAKILTARAERPALSTRELAVIRLMATGMRNKEIASELGIAEDTAKIYIRRAFIKLGVSDRTAAVQSALRRGLLHLD